jgi:hypothetical protein
MTNTDFLIIFFATILIGSLWAIEKKLVILIELITK